MDALRFCQSCASPLERRLVEGRERPVCSDCGRVVYLDPKIAAACIPQHGSRLVLVRRAIEPGHGLWTMPGGYLDMGETVMEAAARETWEEAGLRVSVDSLLGVYSYRDRPAVVIVYRAQVVEGEPLPGPECLEARYFEPHQLPWEELAFPSVHDALKDLLGLSRPGPPES